MKNYKKMMGLALTGVLSLSLLTACGDKKADPTPTPQVENTTPVETTLKTVQEGKLTLSTNAEFPPYEMLDDSGKPIGIDMEVAEAIAKKLGLELVINDMGFDNALLAAQNGQSDIAMAGITVNEDRLAVMDFTDSYATGVQVVIVKEGSEVNMDNLGDYQIGPSWALPAISTPPIPPKTAVTVRTTSLVMKAVPWRSRLWSTARWMLLSSTTCPPPSM